MITHDIKKIQFSIIIQQISKMSVLKDEYHDITYKAQVSYFIVIILPNMMFTPPPTFKAETDQLPYLDNKYKDNIEKGINY